MGEAKLKRIQTVGGSVATVADVPALSDGDVDASPTCASCPYWHRVPMQEASKDPIIGQCRRYPPKIFIVPKQQRNIVTGAIENGAGAMPMNPQTEIGFWCGEHPDIVGAVDDALDALMDAGAQDEN